VPEGTVQQGHRGEREGPHDGGGGPGGCGGGVRGPCAGEGEGRGGAGGREELASAEGWGHDRCPPHVEEPGRRCPSVAPLLFEMTNVVRHAVRGTRYAAVV